MLTAIAISLFVLAVNTAAAQVSNCGNHGYPFDPTTSTLPNYGGNDWYLDDWCGTKTPYKEQFQTRIFTNEDGTQYRLLKQVSKYLLENYSEHIHGHHVLSLADLPSNRYSSTRPASRWSRSSSSGSDGDFVVVAPGCYEVPINLFGQRLMKVEVSESQPVGLEANLKVYRKLSMTGYQRDLDLLIFRAREASEQDEDQDSIRVYQSTYYGDWDSGTLNGYSVLSKRKLDTVFLDTGMSEKVLQDAHKFFNRAEEYKKHGIPYHRNYLLVGPPGTGKTSLIHALASELDMGIAVINFHPYYSKLSLTTNIANLPKNTVIVVEDVDSLYTAGREHDPRANGLTFSDFINVIDGFTSSNNGVLLFMTTNHPDKIDPALLRPGRVDMRLTLSYASESQVQQIFNAYYDSDEDRLVFQSFYSRMKELGLENRMTTASLQNFFFRHLGETALSVYAAADELVEYLPPAPTAPTAPETKVEKEGEKPTDNKE